MDRTVEHNAAEVRGIEVGRDLFRRAVLIACSVEKSKGGRPRKTPADAEVSSE